MHNDKLDASMFACIFCISIGMFFFVENGVSEEVDVDDLLVSLKHKIDSDSTLPTCVASVSSSLRNIISSSLSCYW